VRGWVRPDGKEIDMPDISLGSVARGSRSLRAYLARPSGPGPWPGVVAIHEVFGLEDVIRRQCDRLAAAGYLTLAPDLFSDGGARRCLVSTFRAMATGRGRAYADIEAARQRLRDDADCTGRIGVIGFCMGGAFALMTAQRGFDVAADNYGAAPRSPGRVFAGACPVVASYGGSDPLMLGQAAKVRRGLRAAGVEHDLKTYPGAGHSFLNDVETGPRLLRPVERVLNVGPKPEAAADAWARIEAFFAKHLVGE
jgi:carboxymethylenebutenolidase